MLKASDIMTQDVATIRGSATVAEAIKLMKFKNLRALIVDVRSSQDAYGIVTQTDVVTKVVAYGESMSSIVLYSGAGATRITSGSRQSAMTPWSVRKSNTLLPFGLTNRDN